jgi:four helix bundle protein
MGTFRRFEDIQAWQKARGISLEIYKLSGGGEFGRDFDLRRQIRRSALSIMANIAEGQGRRSDRDFAQFLNISLGSLAETKSHLYLALDLNYLSEDSFEEIYYKLDEVGRMIYALIRHLRSDERNSPVYSKSSASRTS